MKTTGYSSAFAQFIQKSNVAIIILTIIITILFSFFLIRLQFNSDFDSIIIPTDILNTQIEGTPEVPESEYPIGIALLIEANDVFNPILLDRITTAMKKLDSYDVIGPNLSPFSFITVEKRGTRLVTVPMNPHTQDGPWTVEEAALFRSRVEQDDIAKSYLVSKNGNALLIFYSAREFGDQSIKLLSEFREILKPVEEMAKVSLLSSPHIEERVGVYLNRDLVILLVICCLVILFTYFISFRAKRAVLIPFSLSIIGIIWTLGAMQLLGFSLTIINIITPIMVLTLGSSYSIHMLNEYFASLDEASPEAVGQSLVHIVKTIVMACITTILGFLSLLACEAPAFKEFGISVSIGIFFCALLAVTYLPAILSLTPKPVRGKAHRKAKIYFKCATEAISNINIKYWPYVLLVFIFITFAFLFTKDQINLDTNYMSYFPRKDPIVESALHFAETLGSTDQYHLTLNAPPGEVDYFLRPEILAQVHAFELALLEDCPDIMHSLSFSSYIAYMNRVYSGAATIPETPALMRLLSRLIVLIGNQMENAGLNLLINPNGTQITLSFRNYDSIEGDIQTLPSSRRVQKAIDDHLAMLPIGIKAVHWGNSTNNFKINDILMADQSTSTILSFIMIFFVVLVSFKSFKYSIFSLVPVLTGVMANYIFMYVTGIPFDLVTVGFSSVTVGVGVDNALHFIIRYRRNILEHKLQVGDAIRVTINETGKPILLTSVSIIMGLMTLAFASYVPVQYFGLLVSIALLNTLIATLFILPAVILLSEKIHARRLLRNTRTRRINEL